MELLVLLLLLISHIPASARFWQTLQAGYIPSAADFGVISFVLYYDLGIALEAIGIPFASDYYMSLFKAGDELLVVAISLLIVSPWALLFGAWLSSPRKNVSHTPSTSLSNSSAVVFLAAAFAVILPLVVFSILTLQSTSTLWTARAHVSSTLGPFVIVLYIPLYVVAFFVRLQNSRSFWGTIVLFLLALVASITTLPLGQRTVVLLPFFLVALFRYRLSIVRLISVGLLGVMSATLLLSRFKWYLSEDQSNPAALIAYAVNSDFARAGALSKALEMSMPLGTSVMPFPGSGYIYSLFYYVPRSLMPFKGESTARLFTGEVTNTVLPDWGLGLGMIEEILLNWGWLFVLPMVVGYGVVLGLLDRITVRIPEAIPVRLVGLWICGYHLPSLMLLYLGMLIVGLVSHALLKPTKQWMTSRPRPKRRIHRFEPVPRALQSRSSRAIYLRKSHE